MLEKRLQHLTDCLTYLPMSLMLSLFIRPMQDADIESVLSIERHAFTHPWSNGHFQQEILSSHAIPLVGEHQGAIISYICLSVLLDEAQILNIAVDSNYRNRNVGRQLMQYAAATAVERGARTLLLEVRQSNEAAIALYEKLGFSRDGIRKKYYEGQEDAVLMSKPLEGVLR